MKVSITIFYWVSFTLFLGLFEVSFTLFIGLLYLLGVQKELLWFVPAGSPAKRLDTRSRFTLSSTRIRSVLANIGRFDELFQLWIREQRGRQRQIEIDRDRQRQTETDRDIDRHYTYVHTCIRMYVCRDTDWECTCTYSDILRNVPFT